MERNYYKESGASKTGYNFYPSTQSAVNITQKYYNQDVSSLSKPVEIIQDILYWFPSSTPPKGEGDDYYFNTDDCHELQYDPFNKDFGPLSLSMTHRFCCELTKMLHEKRDRDGKIYHLTSLQGQKMANSA